VQNANPFPNAFPNVREALGAVRLAPRQVAKDVTFWPLWIPGAAAPAPEAWPLDRALEDGFVGVAPQPGGLVRVESRAPVPVWVPAGEPLGGAGRAAASRLVAPRSATLVRVRREPPPCARCASALAAGLRAVDGQVGFVAAAQDRAVGLELVLPPGLLAGRLRTRVEAWAPWLLAVDPAEEGVGFDSPEALLAAVRSGRGIGGRARAELVLAGSGLALTW